MSASSPRAVVNTSGYSRIPCVFNNFYQEEEEEEEEEECFYSILSSGSGGPH